MKLEPEEAFLNSAIEPCLGEIVNGGENRRGILRFGTNDRADTFRTEIKGREECKIDLGSAGGNGLGAKKENERHMGALHPEYAMQFEGIDEDDIARRERELVIPGAKFTGTPGCNPELVVIVPVHPVIADHLSIAGIGLVGDEEGKSLGKRPGEMTTGIDPSSDGE